MVEPTLRSELKLEHDNALFVRVSRQIVQGWTAPRVKRFSHEAKVSLYLRLQNLILLVCFSVTLLSCGAVPGKNAAHQNRGNAMHSRLSDTSVGLEEIAVQAIALVGLPYRYGGDSLEGGFDCSGLIVYVVERAMGLRLPRTVREMSQRGQALGREGLAPGDLVFFSMADRSYSHAGIYVGHDRFVHAPATGGTVRLERLSQSYWANRFVEARRLSLTR